MGCSPEGKSRHLVLCLEAFISFLQVGTLGEGFSGIFISSPDVLFQDGGLHQLVSDRAGESLVIAAGPGINHLVLLFLGLGLKYT